MTVAVRLIRFALLCAFPLSGLSMGGGSVGGSDWRYFVAGGVSAASSHGLTTPIDVVKTRLQMDGSGGSVKQYSGTMDCAMKLVKSEGPGALFKGLPPALVRQSTYGSLRGVEKVSSERSLSLHRIHVLVHEVCVCVSGRGPTSYVRRS